MDHTAGKIVSPSGTMIRGISSKIPLLIKYVNPLCPAFKNCVASFSFISWLKYIVSGSDTADLVYISFLLDIIMFMTVISPVMVVTKAYYCAFVGNLCPRLYMVLLLGWFASVCFSGNEVCTYGCLSGEGFYIGAFLVSYSCTGGNDAYYSGYGDFSLVAQP